MHGHIHTSGVQGHILRQGIKEATHDYATRSGQSDSAPSSSSFLKTSKSTDSNSKHSVMEGGGSREKSGPERLLMLPEGVLPRGPAAVGVQDDSLYLFLCYFCIFTVILYWVLPGENLFKISSLKCGPASRSERTWSLGGGVLPSLLGRCCGPAGGCLSHQSSKS